MADPLLNRMRTAKLYGLFFVLSGCFGLNFFCVLFMVQTG